MKRIDLNNQRFGSLVAIEVAPPFVQPSGKKVSAWKCQCDCGNIVNIRTDNLRNGHTISCGCAAGRVDITGEVYGRLTVIEYNGAGEWKCRCECGNIVSVKTYNLKNGNTKSCGCLQRDRASEASFVSHVGEKYGKLTVIERADNDRFGQVRYLCQCDCGGKAVVSANNLRRGITSSCGCIKSKGEMLINNWLQEHGFDFRTQYSFDDCVLSTGRRPFFDFVLFKNGNPYMIIEYNGVQHYKATGGWNTEESVQETQRRDHEKIQWCKDNHYPILIIKYDDDLFKVLEGICKDEATAPDMEEAQDA